MDMQADMMFPGIHSIGNIFQLYAIEQGIFSITFNIGKKKVWAQLFKASLA